MVRDLYIVLAGDIAGIFDPFARSIFKGVVGKIVDEGLAGIQNAGALWAIFTTW
jgi:hypothetical protein